MSSATRPQGTASNMPMETVLARVDTTGSIRALVGDVQGHIIPEFDRMLVLMKNGPRNFWGEAPSETATRDRDHFCIDKVLRDLAIHHPAVYEDKVVKNVNRTPNRN